MTANEALLAWAGRSLAGDPGAGPLPVSDLDCVRSFYRDQGITPFLYAHLSRADDASRALARRERHHLVAEEMARHVEFVDVYKRLASRLARKPIVFKGQALAHTLYEEPWQRQRCDIDALVDQADRQAAIDTLEQLGYSKGVSASSDLLMPQVCLRKSRAGIEHVWDLHWKLSNRPSFAKLFTYGDLANRAREVNIDGARFLIPGTVDNLLIACLHLVGHHGSEARLIWHYDIHLLVESLSDEDERRFLDQALNRPEVRDACHAALSLTCEYLPGPQLARLQRALNPGRRRYKPWHRRYFSRLLEDARAVDGRDRARFIKLHLFPPAHYMTERFNIRHRWQLPFWYGIRIARALPKLFRRH